MKSILFALLFIPALANAQSATIQTTLPKHHKQSRHPTRNGIWILPGNVHNINGAAIGVLTRNIHNEDLRINGLNIDLLPLGAFIAMYTPYLLISTPVTLLQQPDSAELADTMFAQDYYRSPHTVVNGIDLRIIGFPSVDEVNGLAINGLISDYSLQNGICLSGIRNDAVMLHGVQFSFLSNIVKRGKGVQIGLFNNATDCDCVQIGLLNRNGKSLQPIINWRHKKH